MTCDCRNTIRLLEWNDDTSQTPRFALCDPKGVVSTATRYRGHADWKSLDGSVFGSVAGSEWVMWDVRQGDKPIARGEALGSAGADGFLCVSTSNPFRLISRSNDVQMVADKRTTVRNLFIKSESKSANQGHSYFFPFSAERHRLSWFVKNSRGRAVAS